MFNSNRSLILNSSNSMYKCSSRKYLHSFSSIRVIPIRKEGMLSSSRPTGPRWQHRSRFPQGTSRSHSNKWCVLGFDQVVRSTQEWLVLFLDRPWL